MGIENFVEDALNKPTDYIAYHVGRRLAELHPGKEIVEGEAGFFDLEEYVRAEKCALVKETSIFNHIKTEWDGPGKLLRHTLRNAWLNVLWKGHLLDIVMLTWAQGCYPSRHYWIVGETKRLAEEFFAAVCEWSSEVRGEVLVFHEGAWAKDKELFEAIRIATFDNLVLQSSLKEDIQNDFARFFRGRDVYERYGIPWKRGVLFIGPPGNGKTHTVKALINQLGLPCLYVKAFKSEYESDAYNINLVFDRARKSAPCLLVLEDLDSMIDSDSRAFFLNELDGFEKNTGIGVLATTNHPDQLDPSIRDRPSRFDRKFIFDLPGSAERTMYVASWIKELEPQLQISETVALEIVAETEGFSFAYMKELFLSAMMQWISTPDQSSLDDLVRVQIGQLRQQMKNG